MLARENETYDNIENNKFYSSCYDICKVIKQVKNHIYFKIVPKLEIKINRSIRLTLSMNDVEIYKKYNFELVDQQLEEKLTIKQFKKLYEWTFNIINGKKWTRSNLLTHSNMKTDDEMMFKNEEEAKLYNLFWRYDQYYYYYQQYHQLERPQEYIRMNEQTFNHNKKESEESLIMTKNDLIDAIEKYQNVDIYELLKKSDIKNFDVLCETFIIQDIDENPC